MALDITPGGASSDAYSTIETIHADAAKAVEAAAFVDDGTGGEIVTMTIPAR